MLFYSILIYLLCQVFAVLGLGNLYSPLLDDGEAPTLLLRLLKGKKGGGGGGGEDTGVVVSDPAKEY